MRYLIFTLIIFITFAIGSCTGQREMIQNEQQEEHPIITLTGTVRYIDVSGGCWGFDATDGKRYELTGAKAQELHQDGREATIQARILPEMVSICMIGPIIEVIEIIK